MGLYLRYEYVAIKEHKALIDALLPDTVGQAEQAIRNYEKMLDGFKFQKR